MHIPEKLTHATTTTMTMQSTVLQAWHPATAPMAGLEQGSATSTFTAASATGAPGAAGPGAGAGVGVGAGGAAYPYLGASGMLAPGVGVVSMGSLGQHSALLPQAHQLTSTSPPTLPSLQRSLSAAEATTAAQQQQLYHYYGYSSTAASAPVPTMAAASPNEYLFGSAQPQPPHGLSALSTASSTHVSPAHSFPLALTRHIHAHAPLCIVYATRTHVQPPGACGCAVTVHDHCRCTPYHGRAPRWRRRQQQPHQHKQQQQ